MVTNTIIKRYEQTDYNQVIDFIKEVTDLEEVNSHILEQSILIKDDDKVWGMVSFEDFNNIGIIRYFIYNQQVIPDLLVNMFFELYHSAKDKNVNQLVAIASHPYATQLFSLLGFGEMKRTVPLKIPGIPESDNVKLMTIKFE